MTQGTTPENCIFCRIARGEIPSQKVYEDDDVLAFKDVRPAAPVHVLLVPKVAHRLPLRGRRRSRRRSSGDLLGLTGRIAREQGATDGFRTIVNTGRVGGQEVYHLHIHVIGGPKALGPMIVRQ